MKKNSMRIIIAILFTLSIVACAFSAMAVAETPISGDVTITSTEFVSARGQNFSTTLYVEENSQVIGLNLTFSYDVDKVSLVSAVAKNGAVVNTVDNKIIVVYTGTENATSKLDLVELTFKADDYALEGAQSGWLTLVDADTNDVYTCMGVNAGIPTYDGLDYTVTLSGMTIRKMGDAYNNNGDGKINVRDATYVLQHTARIVTMSNIDMAYANVYDHDDYADGTPKISVRDATMILQYSARIISSIDSRKVVTFYTLDQGEYAPFTAKSVGSGKELSVVPTVPTLNGRNGAWSTSQTELVEPDFSEITENLSVYAYYSATDTTYTTAYYVDLGQQDVKSVCFPYFTTGGFFGTDEKLSLSDGQSVTMEFTLSEAYVPVLNYNIFFLPTSSSIVDKTTDWIYSGFELFYANEGFPASQGYLCATDGSNWGASATLTGSLRPSEFLKAGKSVRVTYSYATGNNSSLVFYQKGMLEDESKYVEVCALENISDDKMLVDDFHFVFGVNGNLDVVEPGSQDFYMALIDYAVYKTTANSQIPLSANEYCLNGMAFDSTSYGVFANVEKTTLPATVGETVYAVEKEYPHFSLIKGMSKLSGEVLENDGLKLQVFYEPTTYNVSVDYDYLHGAVSDNRSGNYGDEITLSAYTNDGYNFIGWYNGRKLLSTDENYTFTIEKDLNLTAIWQPKTYTVTFDGNGGTLVSGSEIQSVLHGEAAVAPTYTKEGSTFVGWDRDITDITGDVTIKALWDVAEYTVTFNGNGGELYVGEEVHVVSHGGTVSAPSYTRDGYVFTGWDKDFSSVTSTMTVTAQWKSIADRAGIYYQAAVPNPDYYYSTTGFGGRDLLAIPYGGQLVYEFDVIESNLNDQDVNDNGDMSDNATLGYFGVGVHTGSGISNWPSNMLFTNGSYSGVGTNLFGGTVSYPMYSNASNSHWWRFVRTGASVKVVYTRPTTASASNGSFILYTKHAGETEYSVFAQVTGLSDIAESLKINFMWHDPVGVRVLKIANASTYVLNTSGTKTLSTNPYDVHFMMQMQEIIPNDLAYTVVFNGNGGTLVSGSDVQSVKHGSPATAPTYTRDGYVFAGWDTTFDKVTQDLIVVAQWNLRQYKVDFNWKGTVIETLYADRDTKLIDRSDIPCAGVSAEQEDSDYCMEFDWYTDSAFTNLWDSYAPLNDDITVYGKPTPAYNYTVSGGRATITGMKEETNLLTIDNLYLPSTIDGYPVTAIDYNAFEGCLYSLINIPASVVTIHDEAFKNSPNLDTVTFSSGSSLKSIGDSAFRGCEALASITLPSSVTTVGELAFYGTNSTKYPDLYSLNLTEKSYYAPKFTFEFMGEDTMPIGGYIEPSVGYFANGVTLESVMQNWVASGTNMVISIGQRRYGTTITNYQEMYQYLEKYGGMMIDKTYPYDFSNDIGSMYASYAGDHQEDEAGVVKWLDDLYYYTQYQKNDDATQSFKQINGGGMATSHAKWNAKHPRKLAFTNLLPINSPARAFVFGATEYGVNLSESKYNDDGYMTAMGHPLYDQYMDTYANYDTYYKTYIDNVNPDVFVYDFYPLWANGQGNNAHLDYRELNNRHFEQLYTTRY